MASGIFLRRGDELVQMTEQLYDAETDLQKLLADHPTLLSADGEPHRWILISREFGIASEQDAGGRWSIDHLFVDERAIPTLVEVKRSTNTQIRREVVGQMLEYAANGLSYWKLETIRAQFESTCRGEPDEVLRTQLGDDLDAEAFWDQVETNLKAGRIRLMFVGDSIPSELRAIVEFLNQHMPLVEVLALELKQYVDSDGTHQTVVPRLIGETQAARQAKGRPTQTHWDLAGWLDRFRSERPEDETKIVERILDWAEHHVPQLTPRLGRSVKNPGARLWLDDTVALLTIYPGFTDWYLEIVFAALARTPPFDSLSLRRELKDRLNQIPGVAIPDERLNKFPSIQARALTESFGYDAFISAIDWAITTLTQTEAVVASVRTRADNR